MDGHSAPFGIHLTIAESDFVTALGEVTMRDEDGRVAHYSYCNVGRFLGGKIVELRAFVIKNEVGDPSRVSQGLPSDWTGPIFSRPAVKNG